MNDISRKLSVKFRSRILGATLPYTLGNFIDVASQRALCGFISTTYALVNIRSPTFASLTQMDSLRLVDASVACGNFHWLASIDKICSLGLAALAKIRSPRLLSLASQNPFASEALTNH